MGRETAISGVGRPESFAADQVEDDGLDVLGHPVSLAVELSLLGAKPSAGPEVFEACHRLRHLVGTGDAWLEPLDEPAQHVRRDNDPPKVVLGDEPSEVRLGASTLRHTLWSAC
jgi:hypothetical protein